MAPWVWTKAYSFDLPGGFMDCSYRIWTDLQMHRLSEPVLRGVRIMRMTKLPRWALS